MLLIIRANTSQKELQELDLDCSPQSIYKTKYLEGWQVYLEG